MVYIADEGGKQRGADVGSKEVLMVYMRRLEKVVGELYSSSQVWSHRVLRCRMRISQLYFLSSAVVLFFGPSC